jgi:hypothetical protein
MEDAMSKKVGGKSKTKSKSLKRGGKSKKK